MSLKQASISLLSTATNKKERKEGKEKTAGKKSRVGAKETPLLASWAPKVSQANARRRQRNQQLKAQEESVSKNSEAALSCGKQDARDERSLRMLFSLPRAAKQKQKQQKIIWPFHAT